MDACATWNFWRWHAPAQSEHFVFHSVFSYFVSFGRVYPCNPRNPPSSLSVAARLLWILNRRQLRARRSTMNNESSTGSGNWFFVTFIRFCSDPPPRIGNELAQGEIAVYPSNCPSVVFPAPFGPAMIQSSGRGTTVGIRTG